MRIVPSRDVSPREVADTNLSQPALSGYTEPLHSSRFHVVHPTQSGQTTPRRVRPTRTRGSPRRRSNRPSHTEQATQHFLYSDEEWRNFKKEQHRDYMEVRREQNRIREHEVQVQRGWQNLTSQALDILNKLVDKYCRDN